MDWRDLTIYLDEPKRIEEALEIITDDFEDYCQQTVIDLRDACLNLISIIDAPCPDCEDSQYQCEDCECQGQ